MTSDPDPVMDDPRAGTLYTWHFQVLEDLRRLHDECGTSSYSVTGLAGNAGKTTTSNDMARYLEKLEALGCVTTAEPAFEYDDGRPWYRLTDAGRAFLADLNR